MDQHGFAIVMARARECWLRFERHRMAFDTASRRFRKRTQVLAWAMLIVAGATTFASALAASDDAPVPGWLSLTTVGALLAAITTLLATARQSFDWEGKSRSYRDNVFEISQSQGELQRYLEALARRVREESAELIDRLESRAEAWMKSEVDDVGRYAGPAREAWEGHFLSTLQLAPMAAASPTGQGEPPDQDGPELDEGGDLQPIVRGGAGR